MNTAHDNQPAAIPLGKIDPKYFRQIDRLLNDARENVKALKLLILAAAPDDSPAAVWAAGQHQQWKAICSQTNKAMKKQTTEGKKDE